MFAWRSKRLKMDNKTLKEKNKVLQSPWTFLLHDLTKWMYFMVRDGYGCSRHHSTIPGKKVTGEHKRKTAPFRGEPVYLRIL